MKNIRTLIYFFAIVATAPTLAVEPTPTRPVADTYHGVTVEDPYRWLEDAAAPEVKEWSAKQTQQARQYLDGLPFRQKIFDRLMTQTTTASSSFARLSTAGGRIFALYRQPLKQQPMVAVLASNADLKSLRVVVDPNALDPAGNTAIDWFVPSPDGRLLAVSLSQNGSEDGSLHIFDVATGRESGEVIARVQYPTAGGSLAWQSDSKGFWYTRYPGPERPAEEQHFFQRLYCHKLGAPLAEDALVLGEGLPKVAEIFVRAGRAGAPLLVSVANGDGGEFAQYLIDNDNRVRQISRFEDQVVAATIGPDNNLYLVSRQDAPRGKLLKLSLRQPNLGQARTIVAESEGVLQSEGEFGGASVLVTKHALYLRQLVGGPTQIAIYSHAGRPLGHLPLPDVASADEMLASGDHDLLYSVETYLQPPHFRRYNESTRRARKPSLAETSAVRFDDAEVVREFATSPDGTRVPVNIVRRIGRPLDAATPALLTGYGGYGVSLKPHFLGPRTRLWLDAGGVFAIANLRGGGEFGETWHRQGALTQKQNVFDDFVAAAHYLIDHKYTSSQHLAIIGGSNGGLLVGAALTQHAELFAAVVAEVGLFDMLRSELEPNGAFNITEFGTVKDPAQFRALYAYSPYHHVVAGGHYPPVFLATGEHDGRVNPMQSRKMAARLQAAVPEQAIFLSINDKAGHGMGSSLATRIGQQADVYSFLFDRLGLTFPEP